MSFDDRPRGIARRRDASGPQLAFQLHKSQITVNLLYISARRILSSWMNGPKQLTILDLSIGQVWRMGTPLIVFLLGSHTNQSRETQCHLPPPTLPHHNMYSRPLLVYPCKIYFHLKSVAGRSAPQLFGVWRHIPWNNCMHCIIPKT